MDSKVDRVRRSYILRAEKLDIKCGVNYTTHPFSGVLKYHFNSGGVHHIVFGVLVEINQNTMRMIKKCAKYAAARSENSDVTPLSNTNKSVQHIMLC